VGTSNNVFEHSGTQSTVLRCRLYLDLGNLQSVSLLEYLDHPNSRAIHFDSEDVASRDALGEVPFVAILIPPSPSLMEQLLVDVPTKVLQPSFIFRRRVDQSIVQERHLPGVDAS
jgi:hypothetical protein